MPTGRHQYATVPYGELEASELRRFTDLEADNGRLKRLYPELALHDAAIKITHAAAPSLLGMEPQAHRSSGEGYETQFATVREAPSAQMPGAQDMVGSADFLADALARGRRFHTFIVVDDEVWDQSLFSPGWRPPGSVLVDARMQR